MPGSIPEASLTTERTEVRRCVLAGSRECLLADREPEARQQRNPAGAGEPGGIEQRTELLRPLPADPTRISKPPQRRAERVEPGRSRIDHTVDTARAQAAQDARRRRSRGGVVMVGEAAVDDIEPAMEAGREAADIRLKKAQLSSPRARAEA
jgi:hypothetical protein